MAHCPECGTEVEGDTTFCPECGTNLSGDQHNHEESTGWFGMSGRIPGMKPGSKIRNSLLGLIYIIVIMAVLSAALGGDDTNGNDGGEVDNTNGNDGGEAGDTNGNDGGDGTGTTDQQLTHEIGETFTVGSGDQQVTYTVDSVDTADSVGSDALEEEADGEFVIIELTMENAGSESFDVSNRHVKIVDSQGREYEPDSDALLAVENPIIFEQLDPGISKTFTVVFDVPPDQQDRQLMLEPIGILSSADEHYVNLE
jgi:hypothetical protein